MSRMIDADALEELFREVIGGIAKKPEMNGNLEHMVRASAMVIEMIKDAPTIEERNWIPCSERLPEEKTEVLASTSEYLYLAIVEKLSTGEMCWSEVMEYRIITDVIAWMPLPEPYREE